MAAKLLTAWHACCAWKLLQGRTAELCSLVHTQQSDKWTYPYATHGSQ